MRNAKLDNGSPLEPRREIVDRGFTLVEILVALAIVAILTTIGIVTYSGVQFRASDALVQNTVADAHKTLQLYFVNNQVYPSNLADTAYAPPLTVAMALYTDAPQAPVYAGLTPDQNAQLFLNACNGFMPIASGGTTYNTACVYNGNNAHVKGEVSSNVIIHGPIINQSDFALTCGSVCTSVQGNIIATFLAQGGTFPITVPKSGSTLPAPTMVNTGDASTYCLEGRSPNYPLIIYHSTPDLPGPQNGPCPTGAGLHYP